MVIVLRVVNKSFNNNALQDFLYLCFPNIALEVFNNPVDTIKQLQKHAQTCICALLTFSCYEALFIQINFYYYYYYYYGEVMLFAGF